MADSDTTGTDFGPATNDEDQHGWTPDAPGTGEGKESGWSSGPPQGESKRPTGSSTARDSTGVDPQQAIDDDSPRLQSGDQGG